MIENLISMFPLTGESPTTMLFFTAVIIIYAVFVFYFYRFLAKKNIIELNLNQYNNYENDTLIKIFAALFYIVEYIILLPVLTFFWFGVLAILILILAKGLSVQTVLIISAALVASVRVCSFISEDLAKDLAKMLPFTLLTIAITTSGFFDMSMFFTRLSEIPKLFSNIPYYLLFIVGIEITMRISGFMYDAIKSLGEDDIFEESLETE